MMTDRRKAWRFPKIRGWFRHKWRPAEAARPRTMEAVSNRPVILRRPVDVPYVVLSCERCGFDYTVTRIEICGKPGIVWTCDCGSQFLPPGGPESFNLVRP